MSSRRRRVLSRRSFYYSLSFTLVLTAVVFLWPAPPFALSSHQPLIEPTPTVQQAQSNPIKIDPRLTGQSTSTAPPPIKIIIPQLNINLTVKDAPVINGSWQLSPNSASHGLGSANPGQKGNIVIFAHARIGLFLPLRQINRGTEIYLLTATSWYKYRVDTLKQVSPLQIENILPTSTEVLTLYTCTGFADSQRLIVQASRQ